MILAIILSIAILVGFEAYFSSTRPTTQSNDLTNSKMTDDPAPIPTENQSMQFDRIESSNIPSPLSEDTEVQVVTDLKRSDLLSNSQRIVINTPRVDGSISLIGGHIDDLSLRDYREDLESDSPEIVVLLPKGLNNAYYAGFGWVNAVNGAKLSLPNSETVWTANKKVLTTDSPVTLSWDNGEGLKFKKIISIDENYLFSVVQRVENFSSSSIALHGYGLISRQTTPDVTGFFILHEGLLGVFNETLMEIDYDDIQDQGTIEQSSKGGWIGITDKYWLTALVPSQNDNVNSRFIHRQENGIDRYQVDFLSHKIEIPIGDARNIESYLFTGAKEVPLLDGYSESLGIDRFDLTIDWGWFYFLTKPIFQALLWLNDRVGNLGISILLLTIGIKIVFFPLANKSYVAMSKMKKLQPEMQKLREVYGDDKIKLNQEMMSLYKREKANPASGCLPIIIQIPVFFALYKVLFVTIEMRHAPFFGWIQDLSAPDPTTIFNMFGLLPWTPPEFLMIGIWPLIMGVSMYLQQKLNPQPADPIQAKIFLFMPIMFTFLLARFPAGLVIYWAWNNTLSILQQWVIMRRMGVKA